jgi:hypothetical protein
VVFAADPSVVAPAAAVKPAEVVVVGRDTRSDILASKDTPLPLIKGRRTEDAVLRQTLFLTIALTEVRPAAGAGGDVLRWTYQPYLQRQLCFTSITGRFSCAEAEVEALAGKAEGEAPAAPEPAAPSAAAPDPAAPAPSPAAEAARLAVAAGLKDRADTLFADDRRLELDPMLKAAGVWVRRSRVRARVARR